MSATNAILTCFLDARSQYVKPGVKKAIKTSLSRARRQQNKVRLADEVLSLPRSVQALHHTRLCELHDLSQVELDAYADMLLQDAHASDDSLDDELALDEQDFGDAPALPLHLLGSLPDWMLNELEAANGDSFAVLSLFEAKRPSPKAAISMEDEALYA